MTGNRPFVRLLACGNRDRCDDGAAIWAVSHLMPRLTESELEGIVVSRCGQLDIDHLLNAGDYSAVLIVDTAVGVAPGRVVRLDFEELIANAREISPHSSHALPIDQVIGVARQLSDGPVDGLFVGIGALSVGFGDELSQPVREHMAEFERAIHGAITRLRAQPVGAATG